MRQYTGSSRLLLLVAVLFSLTTGSSATGMAVPVLAASTYSVTVLSDNPVSYWRLGEAPGSTTAADSSSGGNTGTIKGGVTLGVPGALAGDSNTAMGFDGSSGKITVPDKANLDITGDLTVEAWVNLTAYNAGDTTPHIIVMKGSDAGSTTNQYRVGIGSSGLWRGTVWVGSATCVVTDQSGQTPAGDVGKWVYLVLTRSGTTLSLYKNGVLIGQGTIGVSGTCSGAAGATNTSTGPLGIGVDGGSAQYYFNGTIDEVAVYNQALTGSQVQTHYQAGK